MFPVHAFSVMFLPMPSFLFIFWLRADSVKYILLTFHGDLVESCNDEML